MLKKYLSNRIAIPIILCLQIIPLVAFPASSYSVKTQEWWLPILLAFLVVLALIQILVRKNDSSWPWYLIAFAQGFNIISRLMMFMPHATVNVQGKQEPNTVYLVIAALTMLFSAFIIWYCELPEVRINLFAKKREN
jgi:hypothetical protein